MEQTIVLLPTTCSKSNASLGCLWLISFIIKYINWACYEVISSADKSRIKPYESGYLHVLIKKCVWSEYSYEICLLHLCCEFVIFEICILIALIDKYGSLVTGEAAEHVKQFISSECSFEDYTQVMICLLENIV